MLPAGPVTTRRADGEAGGAGGTNVGSVRVGLDDLDGEDGDVSGVVDGGVGTGEVSEPTAILDVEGVGDALTTAPEAPRSGWPDSAERSADVVPVADAIDGVGFETVVPLVKFQVHVSGAEGIRDRSRYWSHSRI
jgi:hypothetical protein